jgi:hypothetical protein
MKGEPRVEEPCGVEENIGNDENSGSRRHITMEPSAISCKFSLFSNEMCGIY